MRLLLTLLFPALRGGGAVLTPRGLGSATPEGLRSALSPETSFLAEATGCRAGSEIKARARSFLPSCKNLRNRGGEWGWGGGGLSEGGVVGT